MSRPRNYFVKIAFVACLAAAAPEIARAQNTPVVSPVPLAPASQGYTAFASTLTSMATASSVLVQAPDERTVGRLLLLRKMLATKIVAAISADSAKPILITFSDLDAKSLLCDFRSRAYSVVSEGELSARDKVASVTVDFLGHKANAKYLAAVAGEVNATPTKPTDLLSALQVLFANYNFQVAPVKVSAGNRAAVAASCNEDMSEFASAYYGTTIKPPTPAVVTSAPLGGAAAPAGAAAGALPDLSVFGPIGVFVQTALGIVTPIVEDIASIESAEKRQEAINAFLQKNETILKDSGTNLAQAISDYTFAKRMNLAGSFTEQIAVMKTAAPIDLRKIAFCNPPLKAAEAGKPAQTLADVMLPAANSTAPNDQFMVCYRAVWTTMQDGISSALTTAANYDALADTGDTATLLMEFKKQAASNFAPFKEASPNVNTIAYLISLVSFANDIATAASPSNRTKLEQAIAAIVKAY